MLNSKLKKINFIILFIILLLGGIGNSYTIEILGFILSSILCTIIIYKKNKVFFPKGSLIFALFISFQLISFLWSKNIFNSIEYIILFTTSYILYFIFYNYEQNELISIEKLILYLATIFGLLYIFTNIVPISFLKGVLSENCCNLYAPYSNNHNLIGDYWSIVTVISAYKFTTNKSIKNIILISLSLFFIILSQSRSAFLSILFSIYFLIQNKKIQKNTKIYVDIFLYLVLGIFILLSTRKTTIFARQYYIQGIFAIFKKPFGTGMGNFKSFTENVEINLNPLLNLSAKKAHNLILEVFSGIGILGTSFILWISYILKDIAKNFHKVNLLYFLIFISLSVNFFFNVTYAIPTMLWIWFISLGTIQKSIFKN